MNETPRDMMLTGSSVRLTEKSRGAALEFEHQGPLELVTDPGYSILVIMAGPNTIHGSISWPWSVTRHDVLRRWMSWLSAIEDSSLVSDLEP